MSRAIVIAALLVASSAHAQQPSPTPATPPGEVTPAPPSPSAPPSDFNFDFGKEQKTPAQDTSEQARLAKLEKRVHLRRAILQAHQVFGFITLAALAATNVIGTLNYYDKYAAAGTDTGRFSTAHEWMGIGTTVTFGTTGILALAAPNPYPKPIKFDAALIHKVSMAIATACFAAQVIMGPIMAVSDGKLYQRDLALAHVIIGWSAFGFMGAGTLAYVF